MPGQFFVFHNVATLEARPWKVHVGRFDGTGVMQLLLYDPTSGELHVGNVGGTITLWATVRPAADWQFVVGDFHGTGSDAVAAYHPSNGSVWIARHATAAPLAFERKFTLGPPAGWQLLAGRFHGGAVASLAAYHPSNGSLWAGRLVNGALQFDPWSTVSPAAGWIFAAGEFTGDGLTDLAGYHPSTGALRCFKTGSGGGFKELATTTLTPNHGWSVHAGRLAGATAAELWLVHDTTGDVLAGEWNAATTRFVLDGRANVTPASWSLHGGDFGGGNEVLAYHPPTHDIFLSPVHTRGLEAYCWPLSVAPGERMDLMVSGAGPVEVSIRRCTSVGSTLDEEEVAVFRHQPASPQPLLPQAPRVGCGWTPTLKIAPEPSWRSGVYAASISVDSQRLADVTFVVKPDPARRHRVAVLASTYTWLAYNNWRGGSRYDGATEASFLKPCPRSAPNGEHHLARSDMWLLGWLDQQQVEYDVYADADYHEGLDGGAHQVLMLTAHPEYWTDEMYDRLRGHLEAGRSLIYLGGNGIFERVRNTPDRTGLYFGANRWAAAFRTSTSPSRAEMTLLGVATSACGFKGTPYAVRMPDHALFAGAVLPPDRLIGKKGLHFFTDGSFYNNGAASGLEVDRTSGGGSEGVPECGGPFHSGLPAPPKHQVPAHREIIASGLPEGSLEGAEMVYYRHPAGGHVLSVGSVTFLGSMVVDPVLQKVVSNALAMMLS